MKSKMKPFNVSRTLKKKDKITVLLFLSIKAKSNGVWRIILSSTILELWIKIWQISCILGSYNKLKFAKIVSSFTMCQHYMLLAIFMFMREGEKCWSCISIDRRLRLGSWFWFFVSYVRGLMVYFVYMNLILQIKLKFVHDGVPFVRSYVGWRRTRFEIRSASLRDFIIWLNAVSHEWSSCWIREGSRYTHSTILCLHPLTQCFPKSFLESVRLGKNC